MDRKSVWKAWVLTCDGHALSDPRMLLSDAGVADGSEITFQSKARMRTRHPKRDAVKPQRQRYHAHARNNNSSNSNNRRMRT